MLFRWGPTELPRPFARTIATAGPRVGHRLPCPDQFRLGGRHVGRRRHTQALNRMLGAFSRHAEATAGLEIRWKMPKLPIEGYFLRPGVIFRRSPHMGQSVTHVEWQPPQVIGHKNGLACYTCVSSTSWNGVRGAGSGPDKNQTRCTAQGASTIAVPRPEAVRTHPPDGESPEVRRRSVMVVMLALGRSYRQSGGSRATSMGGRGSYAGETLCIAKRSAGDTGEPATPADRFRRWFRGRTARRQDHPFQQVWPEDSRWHAKAQHRVAWSAQEEAILLGATRRRVGASAPPGRCMIGTTP